ncbi:hypothetical protein K501DRAFT_278747 [Backusella circina FSU 941]|nr:hypothetical protein K501DRAFT_278747 [Backusella circina FSU 941]
MRFITLTAISVSLLGSASHSVSALSVDSRIKVIDKSMHSLESHLPKTHRLLDPGYNYGERTVTDISFNEARIWFLKMLYQQLGLETTNKCELVDLKSLVNSSSRTQVYPDLNSNRQYNCYQHPF